MAGSCECGNEPSGLLLSRLEFEVRCMVPKNLHSYAIQMLKIHLTMPPSISPKIPFMLMFLASRRLVKSFRSMGVSVGHKEQ